MRDTFRAVERFLDLRTNKEGSVGANIVPYAKQSGDAMMVWHRPIQVSSNNDYRLCITIAEGQNHDIMLPSRSTLLMLWVDPLGRVDLSPKLLSNLKTWASLNPESNIILFTNAIVTQPKFDNITILTLQDFETPVHFPKGTFLYDYVDYAKVKILSWALNRGVPHCMLVDFPKLKPLSILKKTWQQETFTFGDGIGSTQQPYHRKLKNLSDSSFPTELENWFYLAQAHHQVRIDRFIRIIDDILLQLSEEDLLPEMQRGISYVFVNYFQQYMADRELSDDTITMRIKNSLWNTFQHHIDNVTHKLESTLGPPPPAPKIPLAFFENKFG